MRPTARVTLDSDAVRATDMLRALAPSAPFVVVTSRLFRVLERELGGHRRTIKWLIRLANEAQTPLAINLVTGSDTSTTIVLAPKNWSEERLWGWVGGLHEELEQEFGPGTVRNVTVARRQRDSD